MQLVFQYPVWYLPLCLVIGAALAFFLYRRETTFDKEHTGYGWVKGAMFAFRALLFSLAAALLLSPLLKYNSNTTVKPIVVLLKDASQSIELGQPKANVDAYNRAFKNLETQLQGSYDVRYASFGGGVHEPAMDSFSEKTTDLYNAVDEAMNRYEGQNLGAMVIGSDGIYNRGSNPLYHPALSKIPVFTIATGDTTVKRDAFVGPVEYNRIVYMGNDFSLQINIGATGCGGANTNLSVVQLTNGGEKKIMEKNIAITGNKFSQDVSVLAHADAAGLQHYRISLSDAGNEATLLNNTKDVYVDVRESKDKILILADAPHPDIAAIKEALDESRNYSVDVKISPDFNVNPQDYSLVIFHQLPSGNASFNTVFEKVKQAKRAMLFVLGSQTITGPFNNLQSGVRVNGSNGNTTNAQASVNAQFQLFNMSDALKQKIQLLPPLQTVYGDYKTAPQLDVMLYQKIGTVTTKYPLIAFDQSQDPKVGYVTGEGLWRWRMYDYMQNKSHDVFNELISRVVQYMAVKPDRKQFRVTMQGSAASGSSQLFGENEALKFNGELYNESYQPVNTPDVNLAVRNAQGKAYNYVMNKTPDAYALDAGSLPTGDYTWTAHVNFNNKSLTESGSFTVIPVQVEAVNLTADHRLLNQMATKSGGLMVYPGQENKIADALKRSDTVKPVVYTAQRTEAVINLKALFFVLLLFASAEWFMRKFFGGY